jgi:hypothetical protein
LSSIFLPETAAPQMTMDKMPVEVLLDSMVRR